MRRMSGDHTRKRQRCLYKSRGRQRGEAQDNTVGGIRKAAVQVRGREKGMPEPIQMEIWKNGYTSIEADSKGGDNTEGPKRNA